MPTPLAPVFTDAEDTIYSVDELVAWTQPIPTFTAGVATLGGVSAGEASLSATNATGGIPGQGDAYELQWERKQGAGGQWNNVSGATSLTLNDSGLATAIYFYRLRYEDRTGDFLYSNEVEADLAGETTLIHDSFDGADTTNLAGRTPDVVDNAATWENLTIAAFGILNNEAYAPSGSPVSAIDAGVSDCTVQVTMKYGSDNSRIPRLVFRASGDDDFVYVRPSANSDDFAIVTAINGSHTAIASMAFDVTPGASYVVRAVLNGPDIDVYVDDVLVVSGSTTFNQTATKHGLSAVHSTCRFNDFKVLA